MLMLPMLTLPMLALSTLVACTSKGVGLGDSPSDSRGDSRPWIDTALDTVGGVPDSGDSTDTDPPVTYDHLAVFEIDTGGAEIGDTEKIDATLTIVRDHDGTLRDLDTAPIDALWPIGIELHGSSSVGYPKLPYRFECRDETGEDTSCGLLDLPGGSDWVLHAPYSDKTLVRNAFAYTQAREVAEAAGGGPDFPTAEWQPRTAMVEVMLNGDYRGVYVLVERAQRDDDRINIQKPAVDPAKGDITGGYVVKIDAARSEGFQTNAGTSVDYHQPHADEITAPQKHYLKGWFNDFEGMMAGPTWQDEATGYPSKIVTGDWVDYILQDELANNVDAYRLSTYLYKDIDTLDPRLHVGPVWDFDRAYGDVNYCDCWNTHGWVVDELTTCGYAYEYPFWWPQLIDDPSIQTAMRCRWDAMRQDVLSDAAISARLDALVASLDEAQPRDQARWGTIGVWVDPNTYVGATYDDEVEWLRAWTLERAAWMDANLTGTCDN